MKIANERADYISQFCQRIGDDANIAIEGLLMNIPAEALRINPDAAIRTLMAMKPALMALKQDFSNLHFRPDGRRIIQNVLGRAATLAGFGLVDRLDEALLDQILSLACISGQAPIN